MLLFPCYDNCLANASPRSLRSTSAPLSLSSVHCELKQVQAGVQDATEDIKTLEIKVSEGRRLLEEVSLQLRSLKTEHSELRTAYREILEILAGFPYGTDGEHQEASCTYGENSRMSAGIATIIPIVQEEFQPPTFNPKASRFYVVLVGKCPGVYSN